MLRAVKPNTGPNVNSEQVILYLDFDGVLHDDGVYWSPNRGIYIKIGQLFEAADMLTEALRPVPLVRIVLSTSWVRAIGYSRTVKRLRRHVGNELADRVIGSTYHSRETPEWDHLSRYSQIDRDAQRRGLRRWAAIDNDSDGWPDAERERLVLTEDRGMRAENADDLTNRLRKLTSES